MCGLTNASLMNTDLGGSDLTNANLKNAKFIILILKMQKWIID